jgi:hypothetical protein
MSTGRLHKLANQVRSQLQQKHEQTEHTLTHEHAHMLHQIKPHLDTMYRNINTKQRESGTEEAKIPPSWLFEGGKLEALKQFVVSQVNAFVAIARTTVEQIQQWAAMLGNHVAPRFMKAAQENFSPQPVHSVTLGGFLSGAREKVAELFSDFSDNASQGIQQAFLLGLSLGQKTQEIAEKVEQVLSEPRWRALAIAATEMFKAFNHTLLMNYRENTPQITGWLWQCRLSAHSCACCIALHGTFHSLDETLNDHVNGQCFPLPYFSGQEPPQSGVAWFETQSEATQREILNTKIAYDLWKSGKVTLHDFIGINHSHEYGLSVYQRSAKQIMGGK